MSGFNFIESQLNITRHLLTGVLLTTLMGCGDSSDEDQSTDPIDQNQAPQGLFLSPEQGASLEVGNALSVEIQATDDSAVSHVTLYLNNSMIRQDSSTPYSWPTNNPSDDILLSLPAGDYQLRAEITDDEGLMTNIHREISFVEPQMNELPTGSFVTPNANATFATNATVDVEVSASDDSAVASVALYLNDVLVRENTSAPYRWPNNAESDSALRNMAAGSYLLRADITDDENAVSTINLEFTVQREEPPEMPPMEISNNNAFLMAMGQGSRIEIHAADKMKASWGLLGQTALPGASQIVLDNPNTGWEIGDTIVIASSYFHHRRTEERTIEQITSTTGRTTITLNDSLNYRHYGEIEQYPLGSQNPKWNVDMRAEVALLSRNVKVQGDDDSSNDRFGGHIMAMNNGKLHVAGAEFKHMGQDGVLGRYPLHWHLVGDAAGQYINNNSIHNSFHKGITIHGTHNAWVENNVVFETLGHGVFLENGTEENNVMKGNIVFNQREAVTPVIASDKFAVSSFWSNNPNNHFWNNRAAGGRGNGFWIAGNRKVFGMAADSEEYQDYIPRQQPLGLFKGNTAHSYLKYSSGVQGREMTGIGLNIGQEIDEAQIDSLEHDNYAELHQPVSESENDIHNLYVSDFTAYMNEDVGIFARTFGGHFNNLKMADNILAIMTTGGQKITESAIIGRSLNGRANHRSQFETIPLQRYGVGLYTDSVVVDSSLFSDFETSTINGNTIRDSVLTQRNGANNSTLHVMNNIEIANTQKQNYFMSNGKKENRRSDELSVSSVGFYDAKGAFTGIEDGAMVTARLRDAVAGLEDQQASPSSEILVEGFHRKPYQEKTQRLLNEEQMLDAHIHQQQIAGHFKMLNASTMKTITRSDGPQIRASLGGRNNANNNDPTADQLLIYPYRDNSYFENGNQQTVTYTIEWDNADHDGNFVLVTRDLPLGQQVYFILKGIGTGSTVQGSDLMSDLGQLDQHDSMKGSAHTWVGNDLHLLMSATDESYHPQVTDLSILNSRVFWDGVRIRPNGSGRNLGEGEADSFIAQKEWRPFSNELEDNFGAELDWRENPVQFRNPTNTESELLGVINTLDPTTHGSTSRTIESINGLSHWSEASTWHNAVPDENTIVVIKGGNKVVLDQTVNVKGIIILGEGSALIIKDNIAPLKLTTDYILAIGGALFQAGTEQNLLDTEFTLELSGDDPSLVLPVSDIVNGQSSETVVYAQ